MANGMQEQPMQEQAGQPQPEEQGSRISPSQIITGTHTGLMKTAEMLAQAQVPQELVAEMADIIERFQGVISQLSGGQAQQQTNETVAQSQEQPQPAGRVPAGGGLGAQPTL